jgi:predicted dehydrogenase
VIGKTKGGLLMKIRWAVIGAGGIAHRRTIPEGILKEENSQLVAVVDANAKLAEELGKHYQVPSFTEIEPVLADKDVDAVYIATPVYLHKKHVIAAARAGKHILCEKPLSLNIKEAQEIASEVEKAGVKFQLGFMMRFHTAHQKIMQMLSQGKLGQPVFGRAQLTCWYPPIEGAWRQNPELGGGGSVVDLASHCIDLLEMFFGPVVKVSAFIDSLTHDYPVEDSNVILLKFASGAHATVDNNFNVPDLSASNVLEIYGTRGSVVAEGSIGQSSNGKLTMRLEEDDKGYDAAQVRDEGNVETVEIEGDNIYKSQIGEFVLAIRENRIPQNGLANALKNMRLMEAIYASARTGQVVTLEEAK